MHIVNHKIVADAGDKVGAFQPAHVVGGEIKPTVVLVHDTAGRLDKFNSVQWFLDDDCTTSAHFVIELDGTVTQMVPCNRKAAHAGISQFEGKQIGNSINGFSLGIELVNPGKCDANGRAWFHKKTEPGFAGLKQATTDFHGDGYWMDYTPEQVTATISLCKALKAAYPSITAISTHWAVCLPKGRKCDTNPLFPLAEVQQAVFEGIVSAPVLEVKAAPSATHTVPLGTATVPITFSSEPPSPPPPVAAAPPSPATPAAAHAEVHAELREKDFFYNLRRGLLKQLGVGTAGAGGVSLLASAFDDPVATAMAVFQFAKTHPMWIGGGVVAVVMAIELRDFILRERAIRQKEAQP